MLRKLGKSIVIGLALVALLVFSQTDLGRQVYYQLRGVAYRIVGSGQVGRGGNNAAAAKCRENLREIERAKRRAADLKGQTVGAITVQEIERAMGRKLPRCPLGGAYTVGPLVQLPTCTVGTQANLDPKDDHWLKAY